MSIFRRFDYGLRVVRGISLGALLLWPPILTGSPEGAFSGFSGSWRGAGQVVDTDGQSEDIRCVATYSISDGGQALTQSLVCASDTYRININSYLVAEEDGVHGHWEESTRNVSGHLTGRIADGQFEGVVEGPGFTAEVSLRSTRRMQAVNIRVHGSNVANVRVVLRSESSGALDGKTLTWRPSIPHSWLVGYFKVGVAVMLNDWWLTST
jgi:hypothetical protein